MMKVRGNLTAEAEAVLGSADEQDFTFLLIPMRTYQVVYEQARKEGISVAEVFQRSVLQYLRRANDEEARPEPQTAAIPKPAIVVRRKGRT
jgi:hypothetical protein